MTGTSDPFKMLSFPVMQSTFCFLMRCDVVCDSRCMTGTSDPFKGLDAHRIKSFFPYKDKINRSQISKVVYKASCWDCQDFYIGKTKRRLHDRKTEHFKGITSACHTSAIADHVTSTGHNLKWDHFEILAKGRSDIHCKIKETLLIQELKPTLNDNVSSEKLYLY